MNLRVSTFNVGIYWRH